MVEEREETAPRLPVRALGTGARVSGVRPVRAGRACAVQCLRVATPLRQSGRLASGTTSAAVSSSSA